MCPLPRIFSVLKDLRTYYLSIFYLGFVLFKSIGYVSLQSQRGIRVRDDSPFCLDSFEPLFLAVALVMAYFITMSTLNSFVIFELT